MYLNSKKKIIDKKNVVILLILFLLSNQLFAQTTNFNTTVSQDTSESDSVKNQNNNVTFTLQYGLFLQADNTFNKYRSGNFAFSIFYLHKIAKWYSYGVDFSFNLSSFQITKKQADKTFPDTIVHNSENISISSLGIELFQRFNFFNKHRGKVFGKYIDMGIYGNIHLSSFYYYRNTYNRSVSNFFTKQNDVYFRSPDFLNRYDYGVIARIGMNWFSVFAKYRLSELMKPTYQKNYNYPELPNLTVGVKIIF